MEISGTLVNVRRYSFADQQSGEIIEGGKLTLIQKGEEVKADFAGLAVVDVPIAYSDFDMLRRQAEGLFGKPVVLEVDLILSGKRPKLRALGVKAAMKAAA